MTEPQDAAAEATVLLPVLDRTVEVRKISEGSMLVLARVSRALPGSDFDPAKVSDELRKKIVRDMGILGKVLDEMIVSDADKDWLDDLLISGGLDPAEAFGLIGAAAQAFADEPAPTNGPVKKAGARRVR